MCIKTSMTPKQFHVNFVPPQMHWQHCMKININDSSTKKMWLHPREERATQQSFKPLSCIIKNAAHVYSLEHINTWNNLQHKRKTRQQKIPLMFVFCKRKKCKLVKRHLATSAEWERGDGMMAREYSYSMQSEKMFNEKVSNHRIKIHFFIHQAIICFPLFAHH